MNNKQLATIFSRHQLNNHCRTFYSIVQTLLNHDCVVHCICARDLELPVRNPDFVQHRVPLPRRLRRGGVFWLLFFFSAAFTLAKTVRRYKIGTILLTRCHYSVVAFPVALVCRIPVVLLLDAAPWDERRETVKSLPQKGFFAVLDRFGLWSAGRILVSTESLRDEIARHVPSVRRRISIIRHSIVLPKEVRVDEAGEIDIDSWRDWLNRAINRKRALAEKYQLPDKWLFVFSSADLAGRKNLDLLLRALSAAENDRMAVFMWGGQTERNFLQTMTVGLGLYDLITFVDSSDDFIELASGCDLFVQSSNFSGNSRMLLEALGFGIAAIAADTPESREVLKRDELLFRPAHVQELVNKLQLVGNIRSELALLRRLSQERAFELYNNWGEELFRQLN